MCCVAGAAGIARAADYVRAYPDRVAVLLSVELCSLTLQLRDFSIPNLISSGLFGDGAAAAIVVGDERPQVGPRILATRSVFYPDSERVMGWDISESGFQVVLSPEVPDVVRRFLRRDVEKFLQDHDLELSDIGKDDETTAIFGAAREAMAFIATRVGAVDYFLGAQRAGIPVGVVYSPEEAFEDEHFVARGFQVEVDHDGRIVRYPGAPYRFEKTPWAIRRRAPRVGEHDDEVRAWVDEETR